MDRHRPGYYKEYAERTGKKDRRRPGYYKDYYLNKSNNVLSGCLVNEEFNIPEGWTFIEDLTVAVPDWALDIIDRYKNRIVPYIWDKDNKNKVYLRGGTCCKYAINEEYLDVLKSWIERDEIINKTKSIEEEDPEWWDDDEE